MGVCGKTGKLEVLRVSRGEGDWGVGRGGSGWNCGLRRVTAERRGLFDFQILN